MKHAEKPVISSGMMRRSVTSLPRPLARVDGETGRIGLGGPPLAVAAEHGEWAMVGVLLPVLVEYEAFRRIDLGNGVRNVEIEQLSGARQPLGVLGAFEDRAAIGT